MTPAIIVAMKFSTGRGKNFQKYLDYMDRDETKAYINNTDFAKFNDYMGNPDKSSGLFTSANDQLSLEEIKKLKGEFKIAQKDNSPLWQLVYSFDNNFLKEQGLLNKYGVLDETKIKEAIRKSVETIKEEEGLNDSLVWSGAIHYNTDNIHIHVALAEKQSSRRYEKFQNFKTNECYLERKAKFKKNTLSKSKSVFANSLVDRTLQLTKISDLMRIDINQKIRSSKQIDNQNFMKQYNSLLKKLPDDTRKWSYGHHDIKPYRLEIDNLSKQLIEKISPDAYKEVKQRINEESRFREKLYGRKAIGNTYAKNKMNELYAMVGNGILKNMKKHALPTDSHSNSYKNKFSKIAVINGLKKMMRQNKQDFLTKLKYEREKEYKEYLARLEENEAEKTNERQLDSFDMNL
ncbi:hypothetical protein SAMN05421767_10419 [Granulicatella balaenopterae]|uniref:Uncharacterized protein n=1 Tax=Granulicatella balaenopterae TaxID=137733 RepID=A0A1H9I0X7_9LACT|nr:MobP2 family relaxase [Granulicatella balaenopterae]SEQ68193.1 hypothetical protein SAMN05421767_10419 [Granulicatella balaenopterae]